MELIFTIEQIDDAAATFISILGDFKIIAINGVMGAGKTTFVHAACRQMQVKDKMSSPTFSIINQYKAVSGVIINHIDLYRVKDTNEAIQAGVEDVLYSGDICFIEWPEKILDILPLHSINTFIKIMDDNTRQLVVKFT